MRTNTIQLAQLALIAGLSSFTNLAHSEQQMTLEGLSIIGNKELPNVLYILPWKSPDLPDMNEPILTGLVDTSLELVDRESILRRELYSRAFNTRRIKSPNNIK